MSLFALPRPNHPNDFTRQTDVDVEEAIDFLVAQRLRIQRQDQAGQIRARDRGNTREAYVSFPVKPVTGDALALATAEEKIVELLQISRVPGASGSRGVFVDLANGHVLVSTSVFYNERNAALGVIDESLINKLDMVATTLTLNDLSHVPAPAHPIRLDLGDLPDSILATAELVIRGQRFSVAQILEEVECLDDENNLH